MNLKRLLVIIAIILALGTVVLIAAQSTHTHPHATSVATLAAPTIAHDHLRPYLPDGYAVLDHSTIHDSARGSTHYVLVTADQPHSSIAVGHYSTIHPDSTLDVFLSTYRARAYTLTPLTINTRPAYLATSIDNQWLVLIVVLPEEELLQLTTSDSYGRAALRQLVLQLLSPQT